GDVSEGGDETLAAGQADGPAGEAEGDGLDEELDEDDGGPGADGLAEADLSGAFADADEHDVHDADAADEEADADDAAGAGGDALGQRVELVDELLDDLDLEGVLLVSGEVAHLAADEGDLGLGVLDLVGAGELRPGLGDVAVGVAHLSGGVGDDRLAGVVAAAEDGELDALDVADDHETAPGEADELPDGLAGEVEHLDGLVVDEADEASLGVVDGV